MHKTTSFRAWAQRLEAYAQGAEVAREMEGWSRADAATAPVPRDRLGGQDLVASAASVSIELDEPSTKALLTRVPAAYRTQINDALLTALVEAFAPWTGSRTLRFDLEGHGREALFSDVDLSRTVGWFTSLFPVRLDLEGKSGPGETLRAVKEQLRAIPRRGIGYGLLRHMRHQSPLRGTPPEICFNYLGQLDQAVEHSIFDAAPEAPGPTTGPRRPRTHPLLVTASVLHGRLRVTFEYGQQVHDRETMEGIAARFRGALDGLISHCCTPGVGGFTPSDFPHVDLDQRHLDQVVAAHPALIEDLYRLSPLQQGILFDVMYAAPGSGLYVEQIHCRIRGVLDADSFQRAWQRTIERHAALRTFLPRDLETPVQAVAGAVEVPWRHIDWSDLDPEAERARLAHDLEEDRRRGFDLARPPLLRFALIRLHDGDHRFVWTYHHLILDGWCLPRLLNEVLTRYESALRGELLSLDPPTPYREYIGWLEGQRLDEAQRYWRKELAGFRAATPLMLDRSGAGHGFGEERRTLAASATRAIERFARQQRVTPNLVLRAAWALLLSRYSGERDVVFGTVVSGRPPELPHVEEIIGLFINTVATRVAPSPTETVASYLERLHEAQLAQQPYEHSPLVEVQGWSEVPRGHRLFESLVIFENYPLEAAADGGRRLRIDEVTTHEQTTYPIVLTVVPGEAMSLQLVYDRRRIEDRTGSQLIGHLERLLEQITARPQARLGELELLSIEERSRAEREWNDTARRFQHERCIHELIAAQASRTPEAIAVTFEDRSLTYAELDRRANQLGHYLQRRGIGPDVLVGLCVNRSVEMVIALLGVLKAGGAYVPLDPAYPKDRLAFMLEDTRVALLLTQAQLGAELPRGTTPTVLIDEDWPAIALEAEDAPQSGVKPEHLAWAIYTSGSTGRPKGVLIAHRGVVSQLEHMQRELSVTPGDRLLAVASLSFDPAYVDLYTPLIAGATVEIASRALVTDGPRLARRLAVGDVHLVQATPSTYRMLLDVGWSPSPGLRMLIGGEALTPELSRRLEGGAGLWNVYGPTETTIWATMQRTGEGVPISIGRPIDNVVVYVLDDRLALVPPGVLGELCVGGIGMARGYLNRPDLTAERFVPNPFGAPGERLYRSGDLGRLCHDGTIEYVGRVDHQVKVRGHRIELGEIETSLGDHPSVRKVAVVAREHAGELQLIAYLVGDPSLETEALRVQLRSRLPDYMIPSIFVRLDAMPLNPNGKIDRKALPSPDFDQVRAATPFVTPRTDTERAIAGFFGELLRVENVGADDNFFLLGGHSLVAARLVHVVKERLGAELDLRALFEAPSVREVAAAIDRGRAAGAEAPALPAPHAGPLDADRGVPVTMYQERFLSDQKAYDTGFFNLVFALSLKGPLDIERVERSFRAVIARQGSLRTTFSRRNGNLLQHVQPDMPFAVDLRPAPDDLVALQRALTEESAKPFDLSQGPLFRVTLFRRSDVEHVLLFAMHHVVTDGWSMDVLFRELGAHYQALDGGRLAELPPLQYQYADYAVWQRRWFEGARLEAQRTYWARYLAEAPDRNILPGAAGPDAHDLRGTQRAFVVSPALTATLRGRAAREGCTLSATLMAAFQVVLAEAAGQRSVTVGIPVAIRDRAGSGDLIGYLINHLAIHTRIPSQSDFWNVARAVQSDLVGALRHQEVSLSQVLEDPALSSKLYQVRFNYVRVPQSVASATFDGLELSPISLTEKTSPFELAMYVSEDHDRLWASLQYRTGLLSASAIDDLKAAFLDRLGSAGGPSS